MTEKDNQMPDWLITVLMLGMYVFGLIDGTAFSSEKTSGFWRGYVDVRTLRILRRWYS